jgi:hypothetical protein
MTPREPLTRYRPMRDPARGYHMWPAEDGDYVKFADVEARDQAFDNHGACRAQVEAWIERDQAREAEIRTKAEDYRTKATHAVAPMMVEAFTEFAETLESLLTPASQEGTTR